MSQDFYPTDTQLAARLYAAGVISAPLTPEQAQMEYAGACEAAADAWEQMTGFAPFLAQGTDSTRVFDGDGSCIVPLRGGYVSITSVSLNGTVRTLNTDYRLMPENAILDGKPITYIKWGGGLGRPFPAYPGYAGPVAVTGKRGAYASLTALAVDGILSIAVLSLLGDFEFSKFRGIKSWVIGTDERVYDQQAFTRYSVVCEANLARALLKYKNSGKGIA